MNIETKKTSTIIPYVRNNREHPQEQIDRIANSIAEFGFNQPIVVDENNIILVGHGRLAAAQKLGLEEVPVLQKIGLSEAQKKAYRILDNKLQNDSTWDVDSLKLELEALEEADFDLEAWGLDALKLPDLSPGTEAEQGALDVVQPDFVKCPSCDHVFDAKENAIKN